MASSDRKAKDAYPPDVGHAIVPVLACVLQQLCLRNDSLPLDRKQVSKFHSLRPPGIAIPTYLARIEKYAACSGECFVLALVYIDRIIQSNPTFVVNSLNIHRLLITSVMLAAKFFDDQYFNNSYYAKVGGVPCAEINSLEVEFLFMTNFTLFVSTETYRQYYTELCNHAMNSNCGCAQQNVPPLYLPFGEEDEVAQDPARHSSISADDGDDSQDEAESFRTQDTPTAYYQQQQQQQQPHHHSQVASSSEYYEPQNHPVPLAVAASPAQFIARGNDSSPASHFPQQTGFHPIPAAGQRQHHYTRSATNF